MFYNPEEFVKERPLYLFDTTRNPTNISSSKNDIIITVDYKNNIASTSNVKCYIIVSKTSLVYDVIKNDIRELK